MDGLAEIAAAVVPDLSLDDSITGMAERVLVSAPKRFALAALSMGGYVAFEIMRRAPERVERLALLSTSASPDSHERTVRRQRGLASLEIGQFIGVTHHLLPQLVHPSRVNGPVGTEVQAMAARLGKSAYVRQQRAILSRPDFRPLLKEIVVPTLVAVGDSDMITPPSEAQAIHAAISQSTLHHLSECGHLPALEKPSETTEMLRNWLLS